MPECVKQVSEKETAARAEESAISRLGLFADRRW